MPTENLKRISFTRRALTESSALPSAKLFEFVKKMVTRCGCHSLDRKEGPRTSGSVPSFGSCSLLVVRSGGGAHQPEACPRLGRFRVTESAVVPASLSPETDAFWIDGSNQHTTRILSCPRGKGFRRSPRTSSTISSNRTRRSGIARIRRNEFSSSTITWSRHSRRIDPITRST